MFSVLNYKLKYKEEPWDTLEITPNSTKEEALDAYNWKVYYFPHFLGIIGVNNEDFTKYKDAYNSFSENYDSIEKRNAFIKKNITVSLFLSALGLLNNKEKIVEKIISKPEKKLKKKSKK